jgi:hypothetical protein
MMRAFVALGFALFLLSFPRAADACACCSDPGYRAEEARTIGPVEKQLLTDIRFKKSVALYSDAGEDSVKGIDDPPDSFELTSSIQGSLWTFTFKGTNGKSGTLSFTIPKTVDSFAVDPQDGRDSGNGPLLYKEWRLSARVKGTGVFKRGLPKGATVRLVFQGRGIACDEIENFTSFSLQVSGTHAKYTFYGPLAKP